jgi:GNAT superfamily N-acetyltransferase
VPIKRVTEPEQVVELLSLAFFDDPTWSWAFADPATRLDDYRAWWGLFAHSAIPYGWTSITEDGGAVAMWIPAGVPELSAEDEAKVEPLLRDLVGDRTEEVLALLERFEANHPHDTPHHYLSLLGTHPDHRGQGKGMALLAENLAQLDDLKMPAYLESSNRANDRRYEAVGFELIGEFSCPGGGPTLGCMWRDPR